MTMLPRCITCAEKLAPYGGKARCPRCDEPCPVCEGDVAMCLHPLPLTGWELAEAAALRKVA